MPTHAVISQELCIAILLVGGAKLATGAASFLAVSPDMVFQVEKNKLRISMPQLPGAEPL